MHNYAGNKEAAIHKYLEYYKKDPFPKINPALLNSSDIQKYVAATGMIHPFHREDLKSASYALRLIGDYIYWDKNGERKQGKINDGDIFELENDSIAFVSLEPLFHLPDYIAARFNLKVDNVYKGLLLGTGPLVDPGFIGYLSFPLHNLTSNKYNFRGGDKIAWIEFTKLSENEIWSDDETVLSDNEFPLQEYKKYRDYIELYKKGNFADVKYDKVKDNILNATAQSVRSTIPLSITEARESAKRSADEAEKAVRSARNFQIITALSIAVALVLLFIQVINLNNRTYDYLDFSKNKQDELNNKIDSLKIEIDSLKRIIEFKNK
jgi:deoxycytidine triphosphate deaminase